MKRIGLHILFWGVILLWRSKADYFYALPFQKFLYFNLFRLPAMMVATYILIYYILPNYLIKEKNYWKFIGLFALTFWITTLLDRAMITSDFMSDFLAITEHKYKKGFQFIHPFRHAFNLIAIMGFAAIIRFFKLYTEKEKRERELEKEHLSTKLAFLKSQVNPHFLFNALNNVYSMAVQKNEPEIAASLENLSSIMHYLTYQSNSKFVPLEKEIELLKNYVDIHHLRIADTDDTTISFNVEGITKGKMIAPVILLPLVENAFKHGVKPDEKCLVSIKLWVNNSTLFFNTTNTFFEKSKYEIKEKGIGLENVTKRLQLMYPDNFQFQTRKEDDYFYTELQLELNSSNT